MGKKKTPEELAASPLRFVVGEIWYPSAKGHSPRQVLNVKSNFVKYRTAAGFIKTVARSSFVAWVIKRRAKRHNPYLPYKKGPQE